MKEEMKRIQVFIVIAISVLLCTGCSNALNLVIAPFAPDFTPSVTASPEGPRISCAISESYSETKDDDGKLESWTRNFAYYIHRSEQDPYNGWKLVARIYIPESTKNFGLLDNYTLPNDGINYNADSYSSFIDKEAAEGIIYYRLTKYKLSCSIDDDGGKDYSLDYEVSAWVSVENTK